MSIDKLKSKVFKNPAQFKVIVSGSPLAGKELLAKGVSMPDYAMESVSTFINNNYYFTLGTHEMLKVNITFYDTEDDNLFHEITNYIKKNKNKYFDDYKLTLTVSDTLRSNRTSVGKSVIFKNAIISGVSGLQYASDAQNAITEFSVDFDVYDMEIG